MRNDEGTPKGAHESPARKTDHTLGTSTVNDGVQHLCFLPSAGPIAAVKFPKALPM